MPLEDLMFDAEVMARSQQLMDGKAADSKPFDPKAHRKRLEELKAIAEARRRGE